MNIDNWSVGQMKALISRVGGEEIARAILRGELGVNTIEVDAMLFDKNGRRIPPRCLAGAVCDANERYGVKMTPNHTYLERLEKLRSALPGFRYPTVDEFVEISMLLVKNISCMPRAENILKGPYLPIVVPQMRIDDYGYAMDGAILPAVARAYAQTSVGRRFINCCEGELAGHVTIAPESRHQALLDRIAKRPVVGIYFPTALQGFSVSAQREQMASLPEGFLLPGGVDGAIAQIMYIDILGGSNTPLYDLSALQWKLTSQALAFNDAVSWDLLLLHKPNLFNAIGSSSGGLLYIG